MEEQDLSELGLTKNELSAYNTLIQHGKLGAGDISKFSQVPYSRIYDILSSLEQKGFIKIIPEKSKKFIPTDPKSLIELIEKKKDSLDKLKENVKKMKEFYDVKEKSPVILGYGKSAFHKLLKEMNKIKKSDYSIKYTSDPRPEWLGSVERHLKEKKDVKVLARYDKETEKNVEEWLKTNKHIRKMENEGVAISIKDDDEILISLIKSNVSLLIRDKPFVKVMKKMFLETYKNAEEIK